jgi:acid phosphatase family membrane protein YuiD
MPINKFAASIGTFFTNPVILSCLTSWFLSQFIKAVIALLQIRNKGVKQVLEALFWRTGGMPSSHTAVVTCMTASIAFSEGLGSNLFAASLVIALVVMRDALGVRRAVGLQAKAFNQVARQSSEKLGTDFNLVKEIQGHTPFEVIVGAVLGVFISVAYAWL